MNEHLENRGRSTDLRRNITIGVISLCIYLISIILLGIFFRAPIEDACSSMINWFGYLGIFISIFVMDAFMTPPAPDLIIFIAVAGNMDPVRALLAMCSASLLAGSLGYLLGKKIREKGFFVSPDNRYILMGQNLIGKYGIWAVAIGCLTPFPFTIITWTSGFLGMRYKLFLPITLLRIPRFAIYYYLFSLGWL